MQSREINNELIEAAKYNQLEKLITLLAFAKNNPLLNIDLNEPLSWAAHNGHLEATRILLDNNADVNYQDRQLGNSALHWAFFYSHTQIIQLLRSRGANERLLNKNSLTPEKFAELNSRTSTPSHTTTQTMEKIIADRELIKLKGLETDLSKKLSPSGSPLPSK